ncbi:hypothetical protein ZWY2020_008163 [Hordeum vulgare]|nr:hypothetical protein ZWY2020_008163 [Hordeum vulgare]
MLTPVEEAGIRSNDTESLGEEALVALVVDPCGDSATPQGGVVMKAATPTRFEPTIGGPADGEGEHAALGIGVQHTTDEHVTMGSTHGSPSSGHPKSPEPALLDHDDGNLNLPACRSILQMVQGGHRLRMPMHAKDEPFAPLS